MNRATFAQYIFLAGAVAATALPVAAEDEPAENKFITADEIKWAENPLRPGAYIAIIEGDPNKPGPLVLRVKFPADFKIPPHWHPHGERFVVLSGSMYEDMGEDGDMSKAKLMTPGSVGIMQAKTPHYVVTREETIVQVHTTGPLQSFPVKK